MKNIVTEFYILYRSGLDEQFEQSIDKYNTFWKNYNTDMSFCYAFCNREIMLVSNGTGVLKYICMASEASNIL